MHLIYLRVINSSKCCYGDNSLASRRLCDFSNENGADKRTASGDYSAIHQ